MEQISREDIKEILLKNVVNLTFEKKDGTIRIMRCTLRPDLIQEYVATRSKTENIDVLPVYDLDNDGWRSFRIDSLQSIEVQIT